MKIKIDFIAPPYSGHLNPLIELALPLLNKNYEIRFITGSRKIDFLQSLGFQAIPILPGQPEVMENIANTAKPVENNPIMLLKQLRENLAIIPAIKEELEALLKQNKTDIVVADFVAVPAGMVCEEMNIPWITTIPTPFAIETQSGTPSYLGGFRYGESLRYQIRDYAGRKLVRAFKRFVQLVCRNEFNRLRYSVYREDGTERAYSPHSILGLGIEAFEFKRDWPLPFRFIGPCCNSPEPYLDLNASFQEYKQSILISLGTHLEWAKNGLLNDVQFLASHFPDVLFVVSYGRPQFRSSEYLYRSSNIVAFEYVPYSPYMDKFDAVIHHGGCGVTYSCIKYLKPCVVIPHDYDQFDFAARIEHNRIGRRATKMNSNETVICLRDILEDNRKNELSELNQYMQQYNPAYELEKEIDRLLKGASSGSAR